MELWRIKANALRLMFSDTDIEFSKEEFENGSIYQNANTREKLVLMDDSIRRAIDLYYQFKNSKVTTAEMYLSKENELYLNYIDCSELNISKPSRVDVYINQIVGERKIGLNPMYQVDYVWDEINKKIFFIEQDYTCFTDKVKFIVWFNTAKKNVPYEVNELEFDLDTLYIDEDVQRKIPYFIKGELYEEDEPTMAQTAKNEFLRHLYNIQKNVTVVQRKVKKSKIFTNNG